MDFAQNDVLSSQFRQMRIDTLPTGEGNAGQPKKQAFAPQDPFTQLEKNEYIDQWMDLIETERIQNIKDQKKETALEAFFYSFEGNVLTFYQKFINKQKCLDFEAQINKLRSKNLHITPFINDDDELGIEGKIKDVKPNHTNNPPFCVVEINSKVIAVHKMIKNSVWQIYEEKPDFSDLMVANTQRVCTEHPDKYDLIASLQKPSFNNKEPLKQYEHFYKDLDPDQKQAIEKVFCTVYHFNVTF